MIAAAQRPDVSALARVTRVLISVAECLGARWVEPEAPNEMWSAMLLLGDGSDRLLLTLHPPSDENPKGAAGHWHGPNWWVSPCAWGALMEKELVRWETAEWSDDVREHRCAWLSNDGVSVAWGRWRPSRGGYGGGIGEVRL